MADKSKGPSFGDGLVEGLREAVAWKRGKLVLADVSAEKLPSTSVKVENTLPPRIIQVSGIG